MKRSLISIALVFGCACAHAQGTDPTGQASQQAAAQYTQGMAQLFGRGGDIMTFCYEGGEGGPRAQGWYPTNPAAGAFVITRYCSGAPCPNWQTLGAYRSMCPQAVSVGVWTGPGGPGAVVIYRSSGGSQYEGAPESPVGLRAGQH